MGCRNEKRRGGGRRRGGRVGDRGLAEVRGKGETHVDYVKAVRWGEGWERGWRWDGDAGMVGLLSWVLGCNGREYWIIGRVRVEGASEKVEMAAVGGGVVTGNRAERLKTGEKG